MRLHDEFEWDPRKAAANLRKHRVSFDEAAAALADGEADVYHVEEYDDEHSTAEDRHLSLCSFPDARDVVLCVCWTDRSTDAARVTRVISARVGTPRERKRYAQEIAGRLPGR
jgi:uncharacterized DUF497 family protein